MPSSVKAAFETWNRRAHYYLGLYFLFFLWLFSLTGLVLNHGQWRLAQDANRRTESQYERAIDTPRGDTDIDRARDLARQLDLTGEIALSAPPRTPGQFDFNVSRPSDASLVHVDLAGHKASVQHFENGALTTFRIFHTFSGSRVTVPDEGRDWILTTIWVVAMDAVAAGLIVMVLGSYYMWSRLRTKRIPGLAALAAGVLSCGAFLLGLL